MAYFDFLQQVAPQETPSKKKGPFQLAPGVKPTFVSGEPIVPPAQEVTPAAEAVAKIEPTKVAETEPSAVIKFQKERAKAKDFALAQADKAADTIFAQIQIASPGGAIEEAADPAIIRTELRSVAPEQYGNVIQRHVEQLRGRLSDEQAILGDVEEAVSAYKRLQAQPVAGELRTQLREADLEQLGKRVEGLRQQEQNLRQETEFAGSERQKQAITQQLQATTAQREELERRLPMDVRALPAPGAAAEKPDAPIAGYLKGAGSDIQTAVDDSVRELEKVYGKLDLNERVPFESALPSAWTVLDPDGAQSIAQRHGAALRPPPAGAPTPTQKELGAPPQPAEEETRKLQALMTELKQTGAMDNWLSVIAFILVSMTVGPGVAALIFLRKQRRGELQMEIDQLYQERRRIIAEAKEQERERERIRQMLFLERAREAREIGREQRRFKLDLIRDAFKAQLGALQKAESPEERKRVTDLTNRVRLFFAAGARAEAAGESASKKSFEGTLSQEEAKKIAAQKTFESERHYEEALDALNELKFIQEHGYQRPRTAPKR